MPPGSSICISARPQGSAAGSLTIGVRPQPAGRARREHPGPGSRSSPNSRPGRPRARRPRATPGRGRTPAGIVRRAELPADGQAGQVTVKAAATVQVTGAQQAGCSERPRHHSGITSSDAGRLKRTRTVPPFCTVLVQDHLVADGVHNGHSVAVGGCPAGARVPGARAAGTCWTAASWPLAGGGAELGSGQVVGQHDLTAECHRRFPASRWASPES